MAQATAKGEALDSLYRFTIPVLIKKDGVNLDQIYNLITQAIVKGVNLDYLYIYTIPALINKDGVNLNQIYDLVTQAIEEGVNLYNLYNFTIPALIKKGGVDLNKIYDLITQATAKGEALGSLYNYTIPELIKKDGVELNQIYNLITQAIVKGVKLDYLYIFTIPALINKDGVELNQIYDLVTQAIEEGVNLYNLYYFTIPELINKDGINLNQIYDLITQAIVKGVDLDHLYNYTIPELIKKGDVNLNKIYDLVAQAIKKGVRLDYLYPPIFDVIVKSPVGKTGTDLAKIKKLFAQANLDQCKFSLPEIPDTIELDKNKHPIMYLQALYDLPEDGLPTEDFAKTLLSKIFHEYLVDDPVNESILSLLKQVLINDNGFKGLIGANKEYINLDAIYKIALAFTYQLRYSADGVMIVKKYPSIMHLFALLGYKFFDEYGFSTPNAFIEHISKTPIVDQSLSTTPATVPDESEYEVSKQRKTYALPDSVDIPAYITEINTLIKSIKNMLPDDTTNIFEADTLSYSLINKFLHDVIQERWEKNSAKDQPTVDDIQKLKDILKDLVLQYEIISKPVPDKPKTKIRFMPVQPNTLAHFLAGAIANACYHEEIIPGNIDVVNIEVFHPKNGYMIKGNFLVIRAKHPDTKQDMVILRAINPQENLSQGINNEEMLAAIVDYTKTLYPGMLVSIVVDGTGHASTNRARMNQAIYTLVGQNPILFTPEGSVKFNDYDLIGSVALIPAEN